MSEEKHWWFYDRQRHFDKKGVRWHFVAHHICDATVSSEEQPWELYFRDDERKVFGVLRFHRAKDSPFRSRKAMVTKIMNNDTYRKALLDPESRNIWNKNWK